MELMRGGELFDYVVSRGTLSEEEASTMIRKVTSAVSHMHAQGIIHRDLKVAEIFRPTRGTRSAPRMHQLRRPLPMC